MIQQRPKSVNPQPAPSLLALFVLPAMFAANILIAQSSQPANHRPANIPVASTQPTPEAWATQPPHQATVSWDSRGLEINASNSSLDQILRQVAADTGAKLEGLSHDQRVFGIYGPGPACDVLSKLLDGSGYNVLMVGSRNSDAPLKIVLSTRLPLGPQPAANSQNPSDPHVDDPPPRPDDEASQPPPNQNPYSNGQPPPKDQVQFMDEILHRQQVIDQQQQQQQQQHDQQNRQ